MRWPRARYSLRTLLLAMALLPAGGYWLALPTLNAWRFAAALEKRDYLAAERLLTSNRGPGIADWKDWLSFRAWARIETLSLDDVVHGRRRLMYHWEAHMGSFVMTFKGEECLATRHGVEFVGQ